MKKVAFFEGMYLNSEIFTEWNQQLERLISNRNFQGEIIASDIVEGDKEIIINYLKGVFPQGEFFELKRTISLDKEKEWYLTCKGYHSEKAYPVAYRETLVEWKNTSGGLCVWKPEKNWFPNIGRIRDWTPLFNKIEEWLINAREKGYDFAIANQIELVGLWEPRELFNWLIQFLSLKYRWDSGQFPRWETGCESYSLNTLLDLIYEKAPTQEVVKKFSGNVNGGIFRKAIDKCENIIGLEVEFEAIKENDNSELRAEVGSSFENVIRFGLPGVSFTILNKDGKSFFGKLNGSPEFFKRLEMEKSIGVHFIGFSEIKNICLNIKEKI